MWAPRKDEVFSECFKILPKMLKSDIFKCFQIFWIYHTNPLLPRSAVQDKAIVCTVWVQGGGGGAQQGGQDDQGLGSSQVVILTILLLMVRRGQLSEGQAGEPGEETPLSYKGECKIRNFYHLVKTTWIWHLRVSKKNMIMWNFVFAISHLKIIDTRKFLSLPHIIP